MENSALSNRIILPIGLLFALGIYISYNGNVMPYLNYGHSNAVMANYKEATIDQNSLETILKCKSEEFTMKACLNWYDSAKKMKEEKNFYDIKEFYDKSTCSESSARRGPNQKVVSFSFYGNINHQRGYFEGIEDNAKLLRKFYPNWIMRLYHNIPPIDSNQLNNIDVNQKSIQCFQNTSKSENMQIVDAMSNESAQEILCYLKFAHSNLDLCYVGNIPGFGNLLGSQGNMWRFLPMADPLVDVFVSRDLDSRPSEREQAAVNEWIKSNLTFHIMRDHPYHSNSILAGMWGAALYTQREQLFNLTIAMMIKGIKAKSKGLDQRVLHEEIWPASKGSLMQHDSYFCREFGEDRKVNAWPTRRNIHKPYNFVGSRMGIDIVPMRRICPVQCRPPHKEHWVHC